MPTLKDRLCGRGTDSAEAIQRRLEIAEREIAFARKEGACDYIIVNDNLDAAYRKFRTVAMGDVVESDTLPPFPTEIADGGHDIE